MVTEVASPQLENGYLRIANELAEALCKTNLSPYESRVFWLLLRKTYGYQKKIDRISLSQIEKGTGINRGCAGRALRSLKARNMVIAEAGELGIQKDHDRWKASSPVSPKTPPASPETLCLQRPQNGVSAALKMVSPETPQNKERKKKDSVRGKPSPHSFSPIIEKIIRRLNDLAGTVYHPHTKSTCKHIKGRLSEGFTEADLLTVVEDRCARWRGDPKMDQYLRPSTLFNSEKFEGYLQAAHSRNGNRSLHSPEFVG